MLEKAVSWFVEGDIYVGRVAYRVRREEDELVGEDGAPDYGGENPDAGLRDGSSAFTFWLTTFRLLS